MLFGGSAVEISQTAGEIGASNQVNRQLLPSLNAISDDLEGYFIFDTTQNIPYERWVEMEWEKLFHADGDSPADKFKLLALKRLNWDAVDSALAGKLAEKLYECYEKECERSQRLKEENKRLQAEIDKLQDVQDTHHDIQRAVEQYENATNPMIQQISHMGSTFERIVFEFSQNLSEMKALLASSDSNAGIEQFEQTVGVVTPAQPKSGTRTTVPDIVDDEVSEGFMLHAMVTQVSRECCGNLCSVHMIKISNPNSILDRNGWPIPDGFYFLQKDMVRACHSFLPRSLNVKDFSQWITKGMDSFALENLSQVKFFCHDNDDEHMVEEFERVAHHFMNNGVTFISSDSIDTVREGLQGKVRKSKVAGKSNLVVGLSTLFDACKQASSSAI